MNQQAWQQKIQDYSEKYNIPIFYLSDVLSDPKVIPMIRGKAFEYSVVERLKSVLPAEDWQVDKPFMNAQSGIHDIDVRVIRRSNKQQLGIECKLSAKGRFKKTRDGYAIAVKCMRSRTLGTAMVESLAPQLGISPSQLLVHNDQYLDTSFDYVITSIGNAFYQTNPETKEYIWAPNEEGKTFLRQLGAKNEHDDEMQHFAFNKMYIAYSKRLIVHEDNGVVCTRKKCTDKQNCGFMPNYPLITFNAELKPTNGWFEIEESSSLFEALVGQA